MSFEMAGALFGETPFNSIFNFFTWRITFLDLALFGFILGILYWIFVQDPSIFENIKLPSQSPPFKKTFLNLFKQKQNWLLFLFSGLSWTTVSVFANFWGTPS